jgi:hypothetical protein
VDKKLYKKVERLGKRTPLVELPRVHRRRLTKAERTSLAREGTVGMLPVALNRYPGLRRRYNEFGWLGVIDQLTWMVNRQQLDGVLAIHHAHACSWFWHLGWRIDHCIYGGHRDGWWYVRQSRGRRPKACPLHARAARQRRWEISHSGHSKRKEQKVRRGLIRR